MANVYCPSCMVFHKKTDIYTTLDIRGFEIYTCDKCHTLCYEIFEISDSSLDEINNLRKELEELKDEYEDKSNELIDKVKKFNDNWDYRILNDYDIKNIFPPRNLVKELLNYKEK